MSLGPYPEVSLKEAREKRKELRKQVAAGTDPGEIRQLTKLALVNNGGTTFEAIAREWHQMCSGAWNPEYQATVIRRLESVLPHEPLDSMLAAGLTGLIRLDIAFSQDCGTESFHVPTKSWELQTVSTAVASGCVRLNGRIILVPDLRGAFRGRADSCTTGLDRATELRR